MEMIRSLIIFASADVGLGLILHTCYRAFAWQFLSAWFLDFFLACLVALPLTLWVFPKTVITFSEQELRISINPYIKPDEKKLTLTSDFSPDEEELTLTSIENPGGGDCFFYAIAGAMKKENARTYRANLVKHIKSKIECQKLGDNMVIFHPAEIYGADIAEKKEEIPPVTLTIGKDEHKLSLGKDTLFQNLNYWTKQIMTAEEKNISYTIGKDTIALKSWDWGSLKDFLKKFLSAVSNTQKPYVSLLDVADELSKPGNFANSVAINYMMDLLNRPIVVIRNSGEVGKADFSCVEPLKFPQDVEPLFLEIVGQHYRQVVLPENIDPIVLYAKLFVQCKKGKDVDWILTKAQEPLWINSVSASGSSSPQLKS